MSQTLVAAEDGGLSRFSFPGRSLARLQKEASLGMARIAQKAAIQKARVEAVGVVGRYALLETSLLTQTEQSLGTIVPLAVSRLQGIGDIATLGMAEIVADTVREMTS